MILTTRNGELVQAEVEYGKEPSDSFISYAVYYDTGEDCPEGVINELNEDHTVEIDEAWYEHQVGKAESLMDSIRDNE